MALRPKGAKAASGREKAGIVGAYSSEHDND
jgi:hypothetical protein